MSRPSCLDCGRKHIAQAEALSAEAVLGYPLHAWLSVGHLAEAETELLSEYPDIAVQIREERVNYIAGLHFSLTNNEIVLQATHKVDTIKLLRTLTYLEIAARKRRKR